MRNKKTIGIIGIVILIIVIGLLILRGGNPPEEETSRIPTTKIIPTVDSSVIVTLAQANREGVATLTIKNAPKGTKRIEYQVAYDAAPGAAFSQEADGLDSIPQGFQGTCKKNGDIWECGNEEPIAPGSRVIVFGSSSSGTYRFHEVLSPISVTLKFSGDYGDKLFEKEYEL